MHRHAGGSPAGPQQSTGARMRGYAFDRSHPSDPRWSPEARRQACSAGRGDPDRQGDGTTTFGLSINYSSRTVGTIAGTADRAAATRCGRPVGDADVSPFGEAGRALNPARGRPLAKGPRPVCRTVRGEIPGRRGNWPGGGATLLPQELRAQRQGCDGPATRPVLPGRSGSAAAPAGPLPTARALTRAWSATGLVRGGEVDTEAPDLISAPERGRVAGAGIRPGG